MEVSQGILMKRVKIDHPDAKEIFINAIHDNQVIAYPTDTIYGLGTAMNNDLAPALPPHRCAGAMDCKLKSRLEHHLENRPNQTQSTP